MNNLFVTGKKYSHLYGIFIKMNFSMLLAYKANFINSFISSLGWGVISLLSMIILTSKNSSIYGWSRNELLLLTGIYSISIGIFHTVFSRNFDKFSRTIHLGELDRLLLKPIDSQFFVSFNLFQFMGVTRIIIGILFTGYILQTMHVAINTIMLITFVIFIFIGILLMYSIWFGVITITIWASNLDNLKEFLYQFNNLGRYPSEILYRTGNALLFLFIPLTFVASIPAKTLLGKVNFFDVTVFLICSLLLCIVTRTFWKFALRFYTSASG